MKKNHLFFLCAIALALLLSCVRTAEAHIIPTAIITPMQLDFPDTRVGQTAAPLVFTVSKHKSVLPVNIYAVTLADPVDFSIVNDGCTGKTLFNGQSCQVAVDFTPSVLGHFSSAISIVDSGRNIVNFVTLTGEGTAPAVTLSSNSLNFGDQTVLVPSSLPVTLTNSGTDTLNISDIVASVGDFSQTHNCPASLNPGESCLISIVFTPSVVGDRTGTVTITDDAAGSPQVISLQGKGVLAPVADVGLSAGSLNFADQAVGTNSAPQNVTLTNIGGAPLLITDIASNLGDFGLTHNCPLNPTPLNPSENCRLTMTFSPVSGGIRSGAVEIIDNASDSPQQILLQGSGVVPGTAMISGSPASLNFGDQAVGTPTATQTLTLTNTGTAPLSILAVTIGGEDIHGFSDQTNCIGIVLIQGSCKITAAFTPPTGGTYSSAITITSDATNNPVVIPLAGTGIGPGPTPNGGGGCSIVTLAVGDYWQLICALLLPLGILWGIRRCRVGEVTLQKPGRLPQYFVIPAPSKTSLGGN
jgi:hypothetical protein